MKRRAVLTVAALALLLSTPLLAQGARGPRNPADILSNPRALARYLQLTPAQITQQQQFLQELRADAEPLRQQQRTLRENLRDELEAASPNACEAGAAAIALHDNQEGIREALEEFDQAFTAILTPTQRARYEALKELVHGGQEGEE
ncbi:MAG TPA: periplasmic heavy metal sensor [Thermoanaerobaculia bacterium]|nr:periplasmic heavy metal sensor [Thermoanaerobaculia bacterium]